ncbi:MAG: hypothetical protein M3083_02300, partial [Actinomycetota bacterium]|nr:hypothetical protein [Actinomycetota bacterium]
MGTGRVSAGFRRLSEELQYQGSTISVAVATFEAPDGQSFERDVVHHPGAVSIVPVIPGRGDGNGGGGNGGSSSGSSGGGGGGGG